MFTLLWIFGIFISLSIMASQAAFILGIIGHWKVFKKAGYEGWESIIPCYNEYVLFKIVWGSGWYFLLTFIPIGGVIAELIVYYQLGKRFDKSTGFSVGLMLLPWLFTFILGIEKDEKETRTFIDQEGISHEEEVTIPAASYRGAAESGKKATLISSIVLGGISLLLSIFLISAGIRAIGDAVQGIVGGAEEKIEQQLPQGTPGTANFNFDIDDFYDDDQYDQDDFDDFNEYYDIDDFQKFFN